MAVTDKEVKDSCTSSDDRKQKENKNRDRNKDEVKDDCTTIDHRKEDKKKDKKKNKKEYVEEVVLIGQDEVIDIDDKKRKRERRRKMIDDTWVANLHGGLLLRLILIIITYV